MAQNLCAWCNAPIVENERMAGMLASVASANVCYECTLAWIFEEDLLWSQQLPKD